jgi:hypothetical protein
MAELAGKINISRVLNNSFGVITRHPVIYLGLSFLIIGISPLAPTGLTYQPAIHRKDLVSLR